MDVEVVWQGQVIGRLCNATEDLPPIRGRWASAETPAFEAAFRTAQAALGLGEIAVWAVGLRPIGGKESYPIDLVIFPDHPAPRFRFGG